VAGPLPEVFPRSKTWLQLTRKAIRLKLGKFARNRELAAAAIFHRKYWSINGIFCLVFCIAVRARFSNLYPD
jgi:hypothetical protein